jgi:hypothetical protein
MSDDDETHLHLTYASHSDMDEAFCARMRAAIELGLESAPVGVSTAPGTRNPKIRCNKAGGTLPPGQRLLVLVETAFLAWRPRPASQRQIASAAFAKRRGSSAHSLSPAPHASRPNRAVRLGSLDVSPQLP